MIRYHPSRNLVISEDQKTQNELDNWVWESHFWEEHHPGYFQCKWCGTQCTSEMDLPQNNTNICTKNPAILKFIESKGWQLK